MNYKLVFICNSDLPIYWGIKLFTRVLVLINNFIDWHNTVNFFKPKNTISRNKIGT